MTKYKVQLINKHLVGLYKLIVDYLPLNPKGTRINLLIKLLIMAIFGFSSASKATAAAAAIVVCYGLIMSLVMVSAHEGHDHTPGMDMSPGSPPKDSHGNILTSFPALIIGFVAFLLSLFLYH